MGKVYLPGENNQVDLLFYSITVFCNNIVKYAWNLKIVSKVYIVYKIAA